MTLPSSSSTLQVNGRVLRVTVTDVTCKYPGCTLERRTDRADYCAGHNSSAARMATRRARVWPDGTPMSPDSIEKLSAD